MLGFSIMARRFTSKELRPAARSRWPLIHALAGLAGVLLSSNCSGKDPPVGNPYGTTVVSSANQSAQASTGSGSQGAGGAMSCNDAKLDGILALEPDLTRGEELFGKSCGQEACHGPDGVSGNSPDFPDVLPKYDDCQQLQIMLDGYKGMISLNLVFDSDQDFRDALAYVRETFPN